ncbi:MAG TPA: sigma-70 family RNA polymerase sigma factor [Candidatus Baltobacteraceae bacterium]|jgi:RNA polymerase sigma factor (sigma-70 family)|nr:sigma-70 family RNA polymerase sigma factor [Candidatus Baltobacteraceae bacterium]
MDATDDSELLREYATGGSETAFAALVQRHVHSVYSSALRQVSNTHLAEEVTQAVFIILARKAGSFRPGTVLAGWLFNTARFVAAAELRAAARRHKHEQEAGMESTLGETTPDASWEQISPFLDEGLAQLNKKDREAVLLRFFERKTFLEVAAKVGANEDAARMRVNRALKSLRGFFLKRGLTSSVTVLAAALSANAVQAAPTALAQSATVLALGKAGSAGGSTSALVKSALKYMAWTKFKSGILASVGIVIVASTATVTLPDIWPLGETPQTQKLADGSVLTLEGVKIGIRNEFLRGPSRKKVTQPETLSPCLTAELKLTGATDDSPLRAASDRPYRPCRAVISGKDGFKYTTALWRFSEYEDGYYGQVNTCFFPRDSERLRIQIQRRDALDGPWATIASFTHRQRVTKDEAWQPEQAPITREVDGMHLNIGQVTLQVGDPSSLPGRQTWKDYLQSEGANVAVTVPWQLMSDGRPVTNWTVYESTLCDSSGNAGDVALDEIRTNGWVMSRCWQSPDPRKIWKIKMNFAQQSGFDDGNIFTIRVPIHRFAPFETNVAGFPLRIQFFRGIDLLSTELLLTNRTDLRLNFLHAENQNGQDQSMNRCGFTQYVFQTLVNLQAGGELVETFAIGRNVPIEFMTKPQLVRSPD